ncbi:Rad1-domain-containing protein [Meredithblackwellia eburnea MCA 4105]
MSRAPPEDILVAAVTDVRPVASMLRALSFRSKAVVDIQAHGIKITVEEGRSIQANAYLSSDSFSSYSFTLEDPVTSSSQDDDSDAGDAAHCSFGISLSTVLECLNIFGNAYSGSLTSSWKDGDGRRSEAAERERDREREQRSIAKEDGKITSLRMSYAGDGEPLVLILEESGILTRCEITTYEPDPLMELPFDDESKIQKLIMKSAWLRDALQEIDPSSEKLTITFSPAEYAPTPYNRYANAKSRGDEDEEGRPTFRIESQGVLGSTEMDYPNDRDVLEVFECEELIQNSYKFSHVQHTTKALAASIKTSIRTADDGLISFQFMIPMNRRGTDNKYGFVEFLCVALDEE